MEYRIGTTFKVKNKLNYRATLHLGRTYTIKGIFRQILKVARDDGVDHSIFIGWFEKKLIDGTLEILDSNAEVKPVQLTEEMRELVDSGLFHEKVHQEFTTCCCDVPVIEIRNSGRVDTSTPLREQLICIKCNKTFDALKVR